MQLKAILGLIVSLALVVLVKSKAAEVRVRYDNHKVYRVTPTEEKHVQLLLSLQEQGISFWEGPSRVGYSSDIALAPHQTEIVETIETSGMTVKINIPNIQALIDNEKIAPRKKDGSLDWNNGYHKLEDIHGYLDFCAESYPDIASVLVYGQSYEGRDLKVIQISTGGNKPIICMEANIHAREWITNAVATYVINELLKEKSDMSALLEKYDFHIIPVTNPDGYVYTQTNDRLWRKTRCDVPGSSCKGADPNRNFGYKWATGGSSSNPCDETFRGTAAFSEPETQYLDDYVAKYSDRMLCYLAIHSYSQLILIPLGSTPAHIPQYDAYLEVGQNAAKALTQKYGTQFGVGNIVEMLYVATGSSGDCAYGFHNVPWVYSFELRDTGEYGFILPANQMIPSCEEFIDCLLHMLWNI